MTSTDAAPLSTYAEDSRARPPQGLASRAAFWLGAALSLLHIWFNTGSKLSEFWISVIHFGGLGVMCALLYPMISPARGGNRREILFVDIAIAIALVASVTYIIWIEGPLADRGFSFNTFDYLFTGLAIVIAIEMVRRTTGWIVPILIIIALSYVALWGKWLDGVLHFPGLSTEVVLLRSIYSDEGMFGLIARISSSFVFMFILFGAFLIRSGAGEFIIELARAVAGRLTGGPGFVAVLSSALTGTISGSAVANTVSTGVITIPLMKRSGFPPRFAAAVEAAASTGGQLMPPIMGAGAFVMATFTQISYLTIVAVSFLPAILYFFGLCCFVRSEAKRHNIRPADDEKAPTLGQVIRAGGPAFLIPLTVLIGLLVSGYTPTYSAGWAILAVIVSSWLTKNRMGPRAILEALAMGARTMVTTAMLLIAVGLIVNALATTGVGNTFSLMISSWAGGNLLIALVLIALASLVLGMGLPVTASYIVLATLSAPALFEMITRIELVQAVAAGNVPADVSAIFMLVAPDAVASLGQPMSEEAASALVALIPPEMSNMVRDSILAPAVVTTALLSAHMIIFWLSQDSSVTPPVCLTAFAAAAIAKTPPMSTGLMAWKVAKVLYIVPVLFAYTPLLSQDLSQSVPVFVFALLGIYALVGAMEGHLEAPLNWGFRGILAVVGLALVWPSALVLNAVAVLPLIVIIALNFRAARQAARPALAG